MRILDDAEDRKLSAVTLMLTRQEAEQIIFDLQGLLKLPDYRSHVHVNGEDFLDQVVDGRLVEDELTIALYDPHDMENNRFLHRRILKLICDYE